MSMQQQPTNHPDTHFLKLVSCNFSLLFCYYPIYLGIKSQPALSHTPCQTLTHHLNFFPIGLRRRKKPVGSNERRRRCWWRKCKKREMIKPEETATLIHKQSQSCMYHYINWLDTSLKNFFLMWLISLFIKSKKKRLISTFFLHVKIFFCFAK